MVVKKNKLISLIFVYSILCSFAIVPPLQYQTSATTQYQYLLKKAQSNIKYWGITGPIDLDPGDGGGGGFLPDFVLKLLLSIDTNIENSWEQTQILNDEFEQDSYQLFPSSGSSDTEFLQNLKDADSHTRTKLCVSFIGEGTMVTTGGRSTPALIMANGDTVIDNDIASIRSEMSSWKTSAVFLYSCHSTATADLAYQFYQMGADVVIGYKEQVETYLALELTKLFWKNYETDQTSLEAAYFQTQADFDEAESWGTFIREYLIENGFIMSLLSWVAVSGMGTAIGYVIEILEWGFVCAALFGILIAILIIAVVIGILSIVWAVSHIIWPMRMYDFNGAIDTMI